jgi:hypothetical protein
VATLLGVIALVAGYIPARRATPTRVDAMEALRAEQRCRSRGAFNSSMRPSGRFACLERDEPAISRQ